MSKHEEFEELCALAATGQLSDADERRLAEHVSGCESCRVMSHNYSSILRELPVPERGIVDRDVVRRIEENGFRERFLAHARAAGHRFSKEVNRDTRPGAWRFLRLVPAYQTPVAGVVIACLVGAVGYRALHSGRAFSSRIDSTDVARIGAGPKPAQNANDDLAKRISELQSANSDSQRTAAELRAENAELLARLEAMEKELVTSRGERQDLEQTVSRVTEMNGQLAAQMDQNTQVLAQTKAELEGARADRAAMEAQVTAANTDVNHLSEQVRLQIASLDRERELLFAGRDITNLMGARNLHIVDVHDADGSGKDRKAFGRVFYTEGKSLIFYAFDLDDKKVASAKYAFEAWGERLGQNTSVKSLGVLYVDDKDQRRWVLKVDDPRQLAAIDSVFVTLEPHDDPTGKPRGHKILYAFLGGEANHP